MGKIKATIMNILIPGFCPLMKAAMIKPNTNSNKTTTTTYFIVTTKEFWNCSSLMSSMKFLSHTNFLVSQGVASSQLFKLR